jgi:hypothetical protein
VNAAQTVWQLTSLEFKTEGFTSTARGKIFPLPIAAVHDVSALRPLSQEPSALLARFNTLTQP